MANKKRDVLKDVGKASDPLIEPTRQPKSAGKERGTVWDSPRVKAILERPAGTPIDLSGLREEERHALAREAKGMWVDHPEITDSVEWVRGLREGLSRSFRDKD